MLNKLFLSATVYALRLVCAKPYHQFQKKLMQPCIAQDKLLKKLIKDLSKTEYGKQYHITGQETYAEFSRKLPIQTYATMEPWIDRQLARPTERVITPYRIIHTEPTSGSSGAIKLIPYTLPLVQSFSSMFGIWVFDQLQNGFKPSTGRMFISISPASGTVTSGFSSDTEYLREPLRSLLAAFLVFPPKNNFTKNMDKTTFYDQLAITLLTETDLEIISIWSPSYWLVLLEYIQSNRNRFALLLPIKQRNILLAQTINWEALWPRLKLISCWADALSKPLANQLVNLFPDSREGLTGYRGTNQHSAHFGFWPPPPPW
jgi:GH3 auxin-responsive promoter